MYKYRRCSGGDQQENGEDWFCQWLRIPFHLYIIVIWNHALTTDRWTAYERYVHGIDCMDSSIRVRYHPHQFTMGRDALRLRTFRFLNQIEFKTRDGIHELIRRNDLLHCNWNLFFAGGILYAYQRRDIGHKIYFLMKVIALFLLTTSMRDCRRQESQLYFTNVGLCKW